MEATFFEQPRPPSLVKAHIVVTYMASWGKVMLNSKGVSRAAYIDLMAGPGGFEDGSPSTPLLVLQEVIKTPKLAAGMVTQFNDRDLGNATKLRTSIEALPGVNTLKNRPVVTQHEVNEDIARSFENMHLAPTLCFIDPFGYKPVTRRLLASLLKDWGCECIFFFNYRRINMAVSNPKLHEALYELFGRERTDRLGVKVANMGVAERENTVIATLNEAVRELGREHGYNLVLPFRFCQGSGRRVARVRTPRTMHHLVFVTKHLKGYTIMKDIMANHSSSPPAGVPSFEYNPVVEATLKLDDLAWMQDLQADLLKDFAGQSLMVQDLYDRHHVGQPYIMRNYQRVLVSLEEQGLVIVTPPAGQRRPRGGKASLAPTKCTVTFPEV